MNQFVPDWSNMADTSRPLGEDDDLVELLWCNGHVVMQSQTHRKLPPRPEKPIAAAAPAAVQDDEAGLWFPFSLADSLDKDIFSELFYEPPAAPPEPAAAGADGGKPSRNDPRAVDEKRGGFSALMPPPKSTTHAPCSRLQTMSLAGGAADLSDLVQPRARSVAAADAGAASMLSAVEASVCGSNLQRTVSGPGSAGALPDTAHGDAIGRGREATVASSSGRSNGCFGTTTTTTEPTSTSNRSSRRKRMDTEDSESPSEDAESESALLERKPPQKVTTARRSRAAEVHNLSERRRRDRINEKMKTLQDLIPHCNKTDKASMLDEAIEYLKSLQMQVQAGQMMWMGSGMAPPVMFPGVHHQYLQQMGVGMGAAAMPPSMQRMPFMAAAQQVVPSAPAVSPMSLCAPQGHASPAYGGHMPGVGMPAHYLGVNHLQPPPSQGVGYYPLEAKIEQLHVPIGTTPAATATPARILLPPENAQSRR